MDYRNSLKNYSRLKTYYILILLFIFLILFSSNQNFVMANSVDSDNDGFNDDLELAYNKDPNNSSDFPLDTDGDKIPNNDSANGNFSGDIDDDGDGISNSIENLMGSNPLDSSDILKIQINSNDYYLMDLDNDKIFDKLYIKNSRVIQIDYNDEVYLIDLDMDGTCDYTYSNGNVNEYSEPVESFDIPWILVIATLIIVVILLIAILFKLGVIYLYEEYSEE